MLNLSCGKLATILLATSSAVKALVRQSLDLNFLLIKLVLVLTCGVQILYDQNNIGIKS